MTELPASLLRNFLDSPRRDKYNALTLDSNTGNSVPAAVVPRSWLVEDVLQGVGLLLFSDETVEIR